MSGCAGIFWMSEVFMYCRYLEMMDLVVYECMLTLVIFSPTWEKVYRPNID
jgi:hypothetical protein